MTLKVIQMIHKLMQVKRKNLAQPSSMYKTNLRWRGKARDYPGANEIVNMNKQKVIGKKKPKIRIV